ncbi:hypothetical protein DL96DRAFT_1681900 [Flagelloscypha sp. PMI_526]|nr:hypothetical protein DL96DRAFT_1681900 [Flagelloscypha sp. PMI_526]
MDIGDIINLLALEMAVEGCSLGLRAIRWKGDIQSSNNLSPFRARDAFRDDEKNTRHLLRLWLRDEENAWKILEQLDGLWNKLYYTAKPEVPVEPQILHASEKSHDDEGKEG